ncbi:hypothetical protein D3093_33860 (plasmid) [Azospirillum argentinense]|uniref:Uncharacterized protein n=1 Tax=Azospirillum argentinense TaxID=2970906 RepID=A0A4D8PQT3_9PROT|nr:hypothetical protein D3093_33860 [Azospirillum argentinense]
MAALESSVAAAQNDLKGVIANVQETETLIQRWATALNSSIDGFQSSLGDVTALYSAVQSDYTTLGNTISELRSKISTFNALVPAEAIGSAVAVISSATYIPLMMSWNPFVGGIFAIGLFIAFTEAELAAAAQAEEVQQLQDQLQQDAAEQSDDVKALASLLNTSALLNELSQEATSLIAADGPVSTVEAMLETLISGTQAVLSELTDAAQAANTGQIQQTASDLASAQATWNAVVALAQTYSSNLSFNVQLTSVSVINAGTVTQVSMPT